MSGTADVSTKRVTSMPAHVSGMPGATAMLPFWSTNLMRSNRQTPIDWKCVTNRVSAFALAVTLSVVASVSADDNVRAVQTKLRDGGFYLGEIDAAAKTGPWRHSLQFCLIRFRR